MNITQLLRPFAMAGLLLGALPELGAVPQLLHYQGRVVVAGVNFDGPGLFRFALVDDGATTTYWSNDGTSTAGSEPTAAVSLTVTKGLYAVLLGDTAVANMSAVPAEVFATDDVRLRVWFDDGANGSLLLAPDQRIAAVGYAMVADRAGEVLLSDVIAAPIAPVVAWGRNNTGQTAVPVPLAKVAAVSGGGGHSLVLFDDGTVQAWGDDASGQATVPGGLVSVTRISAGASHSLARKSDGTVVAWGANNFGQSTVPGGLAGVTAVAAGEKHSLALKDDGTVTGWGDNSFGQTTIPAGATGITAIAAGNDHCLALKSDGTVLAWGRNDIQQSTVPGGLINVIAIAAGAHHSLALKDDGSVTAWGWNGGAQTDVPVGLTGATAIAGGFTFSAALKDDGTVEVWGDNSYGQGVLPTGLDLVQSLAAGANHLLALHEDLIPAEVARLDQQNVFRKNLGIGRTPAVNALEVEGQASKTTAGNWASNSDHRIKTDIRPVTGALEMIDLLNPVTFRYTPEHRAEHPLVDDLRYYNVIAQEFRKVFPDAVRGSGDLLADGSEILQVDTYPATIATIAAVQELNAKLKEKDDEIAAMKAQLEARLEALENVLQPEMTP